MAKASSDKQYNNFTKGLITEASPLTFPENAALDLDNLVLERTGKLSRRLGIDYETDFTLIDTGINEAILSSSKQSFHRWDSPSGNVTISIGVVRVYNKLWFVNLLTSTPSSNLLNQNSPISLSGLANSDIETSVINNNLVLVSEDLDSPVLLTYNAITDIVTAENIDIKVRDIWGAEDSYEINQRPADLIPSHKYNLRNQGWNSTITSTCGTDPLDCMKDTLGVYPSNADIWTLGKIGDIASANFEKFDPTSLNRNSFDNAPAPKGKFIIDAFNRGASREDITDVIELPADIENGRLSTIATFASRVFYSGVTSNVSGSDNRSPNYSGFIFFSQVATSLEVLGKCYQEADPTSPTISDIIDTDGGTIQIPEAAKIYRLLGTKSSLLVFAQNGVWEIFGDTGGFTATSYQISKISSVGTSNSKSVVEVNGSVLYWTRSGIFMLTQDQVSGRYQAENITISTIQTLYNSFSSATRDNSRGFYDEPQNRVRWLFNDNENYSNTNYINKYNRELILDLTLQAFYTNTIGELLTNSPFVCAYIEIPRYTSATSLEPVFADNEPVFVSADEVIVNASTISPRVSQFNFLVLTGTSFTIGVYNNDTFFDWKTADENGIDFSSFIVTGYEIYGDLMRRKQVPYLVMLLEKTEDGFITSGDTLESAHPSSCLVQAQWNWANSASGGKWGTQFQAYRFKRSYIPSGPNDDFDDGDRVIVTKNKLRGSGKALSLKIQSEAGKDMRVLGWSTSLTGGSAV